MKTYLKYLLFLTIIVASFIIYTISQRKAYGMTKYNNRECKDNLNTKNDSLNDEIFIFENDTLLQKLYITKINSKEFSFKLSSTNKIRHQTAQISGNALNKKGIIEIDENEDGEAFPVYVYTFKGECYLDFRIDVDSFNTIKIGAADCVKFNPFCPFTSIDVLKKIE